MTVVEHGTVEDFRNGNVNGNFFLSRGKVFEVLVVGGDDAPGAMGAELTEDGLGYGSTYLGFGACAKLVDEQQGVFVGMANHRLHVEKVGRVGGEVVFDALLVADVYHYVTEGATGATVAHWDGESALQHILQQADGLETDGFAPGIRTRDDEDNRPGLTPSPSL